MTRSAETQRARKNSTMKKAKEQVARDYGNTQLDQDFSNWLSSGGYDNSGVDQRKYKIWTDSRYDASGHKKNMIDTFEKDQKKAMENYLNQNFADLGTSNMWLDNYWNSGSDDEMVNNFITSNYDNALTQLDRALKRGTLSQSGYDNALENLNTQRSGAESTIGGIGQGIMDNYRTAMQEKATGYHQNLDDYSLAKYGDVSADAFKSDFDKLYSDQQGSFEGDFNLATQDLQPFDVSGIIGNARVAQGVNNTQTDELLGAIEDSEQKKDKKVGLGNKGLF